MGDVVKEMGNHVPESFFGNYILLPAHMTVSPLHGRTAIQAIFLFSLRNVGHRKIFLKNKYKKYKPSFFFVTEQFR